MKTSLIFASTDVVSVNSPSFATRIPSALMMSFVNVPSSVAPSPTNSVISFQINSTWIKASQLDTQGIFIIYGHGARGIWRNITRSGEIFREAFRELKDSRLRIKNLTYTFVNTMFYFRINLTQISSLFIRITYRLE